MGRYQIQFRQTRLVYSTRVNSTEDQASIWQNIKGGRISLKRSKSRRRWSLGHTVGIVLIFSFQKVSLACVGGSSEQSFFRVHSVK